MLAEANALVAKLDRTNTWLLAVVAVVILLVVLTVLWFVRTSVFKPLRELSSQLRHGRLDRASPPAQPEEPAVPVSFHALGELYETLRDMAIRDPLTRTYNRALFEDRLKQAIAEHRRNPTTVAILLIDMVRFKYVNDLLGHHTGDLLLKQVVERISSALRESDTLARLGGDEFTVILPDTDGEQALRMLRQEEPYKDYTRPDLVMLDLNLPRIDGRCRVDLDNGRIGRQGGPGDAVVHRRSKTAPHQLAQASPCGRLGNESNEGHKTRHVGECG